MSESPTTFACQVVGNPPALAIVSFDVTTLVSYDEVQKTGDELFAFQQSQPALHLLIDFKGVQGISSAMLGKLITLHRRVDRAGKKLALCSFEPQVGEMFTSSRLDDYFTVRPNQAEGRKVLESA